jgi:glycosyltransferase involved in cell wall biosynthesis
MVPWIWFFRVAQRKPMRILYLLPFVPWHIRVRSFNLIPRLAKDHEIYLVCLSGSPEEDARAEPLRKYCSHLAVVRHRRSRAVLQCALALATPLPLRIAYFSSKPMQQSVLRALSEFAPDIIYVERWRALQYLPTDRSVPVVCDPTDSMLLYNQRLMHTGLWWERVVGWEEALKFRSYEGKLAESVDAVVFCSRVDLECVRRVAPAANYAIVANGVDRKVFHLKDPSEEEPNAIVFTGNFAYRPNRHAVDFFLNEIFPLIRKEIPDAMFLAVGSRATRYLGKEAQSIPGFKVVDFVPDLRSYIAKASVAVAPITVGAGVSNKLGEAFATGTAVVATSLACGDMGVRNGEHLLVADDAGAFAERVVYLLRNPHIRRELAERASLLVAEHYDWKAVYRTMEQVMLNLARHERPVEPAPVSA